MKNKIYTQYIAEIGVCYCYFLCEVIKRYSNLFYNVSLPANLLSFEELISDDFKHACSTIDISKKEKNGIELYAKEGDLEATASDTAKYEERFLYTIEKPITSGNNFSEVKTLITNDSADVINFYFGEQVEIRCDEVINSIKQYANMVYNYILSGRIPDILKVKEIKVLNPEEPYIDLEGENTVPSDDGSLELYNLYIKEINRINEILIRINTTIGRSIAKEIRPLFNNAQDNARAEGIGIFNIADDLIEMLANVAKIEIINKKIYSIKKINNINSLNYHINKYERNRFISKKEIKEQIGK